MYQIPDDITDAFLDICHEAASRGLVRCSSGNLSLRMDDGAMLITASRSWLARVSQKDITVCRIDDGSVLDGPTASVETRFHAGILSVRPDIQAVLHFQSPAATTLACDGKSKINYNVIPEIPYYIGPVAKVPYIEPGSKELALAVIEAGRDHNLIILSNHGLVAVADTLDHVLQNALFFELACDVILKGGNRVSPLPAEKANSLNSLGVGKRI